MKQKLNEIGSDFWIEDNQAYSKFSFLDLCKYFVFNGDSQLVLSGRTAIDLICQEIKTINQCNKVFIPAYCCSSMVFPFLNQGIEVIYYDLNSKQSIQNISNKDIFYINNYFGYKTSIELELLQKLKNDGITIIYDRTHSLFSKDEIFLSFVDYSFCSLRKWMGISTGAIVCKHNGRFNKTCYKECSFAKEKNDAMKLKYRYLCGDLSVSKDDYMSLFKVFNAHLCNNYMDYTMDDESKNILYATDFEFMASSRRRNAKYLYENLLDTKQIQFLYKENKEIVPLFVPILISGNIRNNLRNYLIEQKIYCPVHWPKCDDVPSSFYVNDIYQQELSLLCDQRYDEEDMKKIVYYIKKFFK